MLLLASASPRRVELLRAAGYAFEVVPADVDEAALVEPDPWRTAESTALAKARAIHAQNPRATVLGGDTVVALEENGGWTLLGKPEHDVDAHRMLTLLNGKEHVVTTGIAVVDSEGERTASETSRVKITMSPDEIAAYVAGGDPQGKAGAYALQSDHPGITLVSGPRDNVVGLPMDLVRTLFDTSKSGV